jgi:hypothetical protein
MPGLGGKALGKLGASVQNLPGGEVYQALSSGAIDGTEWIGPWADEKAGFQEITKIYYTAGFHEPGAGLSLAMNREVYESLTPAQQKIYEIAAAEAHQWNLAQFLSNNSAALTRLQAAGVKTLEFPDAVASEHDVRMTVDQPGRDPGTVEFDSLFRSTTLRNVECVRGTEPCDAAVANRQRTVADDAVSASRTGHRCEMAAGPEAVERRWVAFERFLSHQTRGFKLVIKHSVWKRSDGISVRPTCVATGRLARKRPRRSGS